MREEELKKAQRNRNKRKNTEAHQKHNQRVDNKINAVQSELTKQRETISDVTKNVSGLEERVEKVENAVFSTKKPPKPIYDFDTPWH